VSWDEVERAFKKKDAAMLTFEAPQVIRRFEKMGDLFEPVLEVKQRLPDLRKGVVPGATPANGIEIAAQAEEPTHPARKLAERPKKSRGSKARKS
jgi:bifunctional non-homologous end joining protein LigD